MPSRDIALPCQVRDEAYIKVKGEWAYLYRVVDKHGKTLDFIQPPPRSLVLK
jgi:transposase-like protein